MSKISKDQQLAQTTNFVFKGTVRKLKAATLSQVPVNAKTVIVKVDKILRAPEALTQYADSDITVQLGSREIVKKGQQAIFYTNSWMVGESLGVQSSGHTAFEEKSNTPQKDVVVPTTNPNSQELRKQVTQADMVVTGRVISIKVLDIPTRAEASDKATTYVPISEHNPVWQEAIIKVAQVEKGDDTSTKLAVLFPSSTDVQWRGSPKLQTGQEGIFLLQETKGKKSMLRSPTIAVSGEENEESHHFMVLGSASVQPLQNIDTVRTLIKATE